jgi:hypothetical protein
MQFTEVQELDDITNYARSVQARQTIHENPGYYSTNENKNIVDLPVNGKYEYEKVLADTPPHSSPEIKGTAKVYDILLKDENRQEINEILEEIQSTLVNDKSKGILMADSSKEGSEDSDIDSGPEESGEEEVKTDTESPTKPKEGHAEPQQAVPQTFAKMDDDYISKSYIENKNTKSYLSLNVKQFPMVKITLAK